MNFTSEVLTIEIDQEVATLWLDRPEARNAMGGEFWRDLPRAAAALREQTALRVLILAAKGPHFTVGLDLKEMGGVLVQSGAGTRSSASSSAVTYQAIRTMQGAITSIAELPFPVIAAIHGYCIGGGVDLISACDIRLSSSTATFSVREAKVAIVADLGTLQRLPRLIGAGHLAELAFTGGDIDATRAETIGLVNRICGDDAASVMRGARELADRIGANSPLAVQGTKAVLAANDGRRVSEGLEFVARWNTMYLQSNDLKEAMTAFIERRPATYTGD